MFIENYREVSQRIAAAARRAGSSPEKVTLVAVSKGRSVAEVKGAIDAGIADLGENRLQEAQLKYNAILSTQYSIRPKWHLVGHLQTNKAKDAVRIFDLIHSVDSLRLAEEIDKQAARIGKVQDILIEVKTSPEESKYGIAPQELPKLLPGVCALQHLRVKGLMTIAPLVDDPEKARPYFKMLKGLFDTANTQLTIDQRLSTLSMGMTDDFEAAIEEGATMVRLGRALFEG
ncbi:MAG: YggS family pyridoxal phosphate-dependent enzyme [Candidatus Omnitrophica bacterium]|nr:YggS family pyridoxal phosphate-dependent enzyme [Candidatus Omnitrophota bacterium]